MQHQRWRAFFLLIWGLLFLTSCIPMQTAEVAQAAPEVNVSGTPTSDGPEIIVGEIYNIPSECVVAGYQTFITRQWKFCFAYPTNVYVKHVTSNSNTEFSVKLGYKQYSSTTLPSDTALSADSHVVIPASESPTGEEIVFQTSTDDLLEINCRRTSTDKSLKDELGQNGIVFQMPFVIGNKPAQILGKSSSGEEDNTGLLDHFLCVKYSDVYCELKYKPDLEISFVANGEKKIRAIELLWPILGSFSIID